MRFEEAMKAMRKGKAVARSDWAPGHRLTKQVWKGNKYPLEGLEQPYLALREPSPDLEHHTVFNPTCEDLFAEDWQVVE